MGIRFSIDNQYSKYIAPILIGIPTGYQSLYTNNIPYSNSVNTITPQDEKNESNIIHSYNYFNNYINNKINDTHYLDKILSAPSSVKYDKGLLRYGNIYGEDWKNVYTISTQYFNNSNRLILNGNNLRIYKDIYSNYSFEYDISYANSNNISYMLDVITVCITNIKNSDDKYANDSLHTISKMIDNEFDTVSFHPIKITTNTHMLEINNSTCLQYYKNDILPIEDKIYNIQFSHSNNFALSPPNSVDNSNIDNTIDDTIDDTIYNTIDDTLYDKMDDTNIQDTPHNKTIDNEVEIVPNSDTDSPSDTNSLYSDTIPYWNTDLEYDIESLLSYFSSDDNDLSKNIIPNKQNDIITNNTSFNESIFIELFFNRCKLVSIHYKK